jgi:hypothetical protein
MKKLFVFYVILTLCLMFLTFSFACPVEFRFANPPMGSFPCPACPVESAGYSSGVKFFEKDSAAHLTGELFASLLPSLIASQPIYFQL